MRRVFLFLAVALSGWVRAADLPTLWAERTKSAVAVEYMTETEVARQPSAAMGTVIDERGTIILPSGAIDPRTPAALRTWALTTLAELAIQKGDEPLAASHLRDVLALDPDDAYARAALADILMSQSPAEASKLLAGFETIDNLLVRRAITRRRLREKFKTLFPAGTDVSQMITGFLNRRSRKDDVSFLAELDLGLAYQLTRHWSIYGGYRAVAVTGLALADNQIPFFLVDYPAYADIETNGSLILHGAMFGVLFQF